MTHRIVRTGPLAVALVLIAVAHVSGQDAESNLRALVEARLAEPTSKLKGELKRNTSERFGRPSITSLLAVTIRTRSQSDVPSVAASLSQLPANVLGNVIEAAVTATELATLASHPAVVSVEAIQPDAPRAVSQARAVHNAQNWINGGFTGEGVKVGVIDSFQGIQALMGIELPGTIVGRCYSSVGVFSASLAACESGSSHGTAVAESLVDVAPGVQLFIANPISRIDFANTVTWMLSMGVTVINYSAARLWDGPGDGTSPFVDSPLVAVEAAVAGGATFVTAAGNEGKRTWLGPWRDVDSDGAPEFGTTAATELNTILLFAGETITVQLRWQDSWFAASKDLDLGLGHSVLGLVQASFEPQQGLSGQTPFEVFTYTAPVTGFYDIFINHFQGGLPVWLQLQVFSGPAELLYITSGSIGNPAESANPGVLAVGAASWQTPNVIENFSSQGPTPDGRIKPDIVGADGADTVTFGPSGFQGTSQAAPHVAGLAALVKGAFPGHTPAQVAAYLKSFAQPRGAVPNNTWGYGFAYLEDLCEFSVNQTSVAVAAAGGAFQINVTASPGCGWTATSNAAWLMVQGSGAGAGNGAFSVTVSPNAGTARVGTITIAGFAIAVTQTAVVVGPPAAPLNLTSSVSGNVVSLSWQPPSTGVATGYLIEAGSAPGLSNLAAAPIGNVLTFGASVPNGTYYVRIRALSNLGMSPPSNEVVLSVGPVAPGPPIGLAVTMSGTTASFTWSPPTSGGTPTSYVLEAALVPGGAAFVALPVGGHAFTVPGVPIGTFYVRVRAANGAGTGAPSNEVIVSVGVAPPLVPTLSGHTVGSMVSLTWTSAGPGASYVIHAGSGPGLSDIAVAPIGGVTAFGAAGVPPGTYFVRIVANTAGGSAVSNEIALIVN